MGAFHRQWSCTAHNRSNAAIIYCGRHCRSVVAHLFITSVSTSRGGALIMRCSTWGRCTAASLNGPRLCLSCEVKEWNTEWNTEYPLAGLPIKHVLDATHFREANTRSWREADLLILQMVMASGQEGVIMPFPSHIYHECEKPSQRYEKGQITCFEVLPDFQGRTITLAHPDDPNIMYKYGIFGETPVSRTTT